MSLVRLTDKGLHCEPGQFHIDPMKKVETAVITHAHSDHARRGSARYICARSGAGLLRHRLGPTANVEGVEYGRKFRLGSATVSFHPAGHILGSAQIRIERDGEVWVVSGDYKREADPTCEPFEPVTCDVFVTEATFGDPKYCWEASAEKISREIFEWWQYHRETGRNCVLFAYALGKAQRVLAEVGKHLNGEVDEILVFGEIEPITRIYSDEGMPMPRVRRLESAESVRALRGQLVVAPHALSGTRWMGKLNKPATAFASGWMRTGAYGMNSRYDRGFVLSDHADWPALVRTIEETRARHVKVMHGEAGPLARHFRGSGVRVTSIDVDLAGTGSGIDRPEAQGELFPPA